MADILKREAIAVGRQGQLVVIKLGNIELKMQYEDALLFSQWVRLHAKEAKAAAGDRSRHWSAIGVMHDASRGPVTRG